MVAVAVLLGPASAAGGVADFARSATGLADRVTVDQPDDAAGSQFHVVYALPSDGTDRQLDTNGAITRSVDSFQEWLEGETGGRRLRVDTYRGALDVTFFRLVQSDATLAARGAFVRDGIEAELRAAGFTAANKLYAVYYDGSSTYSCGGASYPPLVPGQLAAMYLKGRPPGSPTCDSNQLGAPGVRGYWEYAMLHDMLHTLGIVPSCAPHHTLVGHVSDAPNDLMWSGDQPWDLSRVQLDVNHDDYYQAPAPGCPDLDESPFLSQVSPVVTVKVGITLVGKAAGSVRISTGSETVQCPPTCSVSVAPGATVTLSLAPSGASVGSWTSGCTGAADCGLAPVADTAVAARFGPAATKTARLQVSVVGSGRVESSPKGIACPKTCGLTAKIGTALVLRATPAGGARFLRWEGGCSSRPICRITLQAGRKLRAIFSPPGG